MGAALDAASARRWLEAAAARFAAEASMLTELDAAIGDGDHGANMDRGFRAVTDKVLSKDGAIPIDDLCKQTGMTFSPSRALRPHPTSCTRCSKPSMNITAFSAASAPRAFSRR